MRFINTLCILAFLVGCKQSSSTKTDRVILPEPDIKIRLHGQKSHNDSNRMSSLFKAKVYAKEPSTKTPIEVVDLQWPNAVDEVYNVWYNQNNNIVCIGAYPYSQTGDWDLGFTHYFDTSGATFAFERNTSFYNSLCTDDLAIEQIVTYYAHDKLIDSTYVLKDVKGNDLDSDSCEFPYDFPYRIYTNVSDVLMAVGIEESNKR